MHFLKEDWEIWYISQLNASYFDEYYYLPSDLK